MTTSVIEDSSIVNVTYDGALSADEMDQVRQQLQTVAAASGQAQLLLELGQVNLGRVEPEAAWKDVKSIGLLDRIGRIAVVTDSGLVQKVTQAAGALTSPEVEVFETDRRDEALLWLRG